MSHRASVHRPPVTSPAVRVRTGLAARLFRRPRAETVILVVGFITAFVAGISSYERNGPYGDRRREDPRVRRTYDPVTGRVTKVVYDADGDLKFDHWCDMDGERLLRMDVDTDKDGAVDRREYYGVGERLQKTEYLNHGRLIRIEIAGGQGMEAPR